MKAILHSQFSIYNTSINITGSKSETNRLLLLKALYPTIYLENKSNSDDSDVMQMALVTKDSVIDIHHAGTAMRFLTAFFAIQDGRMVTLTGSARMKQRPIKILVDALVQLGVTITYLENEGFPPIRIEGRKIIANKVSLSADVSSQYISALLLIAPKLDNGLELTLDGIITSIPYINMTLGLLNELGIKTCFRDNKIIVLPKEEVTPMTMVIESDWSSASYFYSIVALSENAEIQLSSYKKNSLQGDSALAEIYKELGVETIFERSTVLLKKQKKCQPLSVTFQLNNTPDIAQTIAVTCFGLGIECHLTGLHTLKVKETDRLEALKTELTKLGAQIAVTNDSLTLEASHKINPDIVIPTYNDHRMAMAFAPLAIKTPIVIKEAEVVSKSYPDFWKDIKKLGFHIIQE